MSKTMLDPETPQGKHFGSQEHSKAGQFVKSAMYGGLDGLITTLAIALSGIGSGLSAGLIVAVGLSSLIGDGLSMAISDYLGTKSDDDFMKQEEEREQAEIQADFQGEKSQMVELYKGLGLEQPVAKQIVDILSTNKQGFLKVMMIEQLHLISGGQNAIGNAIVTFISFCIFGLIPLLPFIVADARKLQTNSNYTIITIVISGFCLILIGIGKALVTSIKWYLTVSETVLVGSICASIAYGIGLAFENGV